jgi:hypothetical protein
MERLYMEREDQLTREIEEYNHRLKFIQKDMPPPFLPPYLTEDDNPLKNKPVARTPQPNAPMTDNFVKYKINIQIPSKIDLSQVKVLWSKEKENAEEERQRLEELRLKKEAEHKRLTNLVLFSRDTTLSLFET